MVSLWYPKLSLDTKVAGSSLSDTVESFLHLRKIYCIFCCQNFIFANSFCKNLKVLICLSLVGIDLWIFVIQVDNITTWQYGMTQFLCTKIWNLGYLYQWCIIEQNDSFRYFRLWMSTCSDSICINTFETSHVRFIHENLSVLITTPLDHIQQNLLRKETCRNKAKPADIVLQTWFEEYQTPP